MLAIVTVVNHFSFGIGAGDLKNTVKDAGIGAHDGGVGIPEGVGFAGETVVTESGFLFFTIGNKGEVACIVILVVNYDVCLLYTSPSPRDRG